jgi:glucose-6-phosphate 1-dehydrogenase
VYLAVPPGLVEHVAAQLANVGLSAGGTLVVVEKPFAPASHADQRRHSPSAMLEANYV